MRSRTEISLLFAIVGILLLTVLLDPNHTYLHQPIKNLSTIIYESSFLGIFAIGAAIVIIAGGIDLSSGSVIAFSASVCACVMLLLAPDPTAGVKDLPFWVIAVAALTAIVSGILIGTFHAWLITVIGLPPFVATLASLVGLRSLARILIIETNLTIDSTLKSIPMKDDSFREVFSKSLFSIGDFNFYLVTFVFILISIACWFLLKKTITGRHIYALGGNEEAAKLSGIRTDRLKWLAYTLSSVLASIAGVLYLGKIGSANPTQLAVGYELNSIAASVVGGCSLTGGIGSITGTILGVVFLRSVILGINYIVEKSADTYEGIIVGLLVILAVAFSEIQGNLRTKKMFPGGLGVVAIIALTVLICLFTFSLSETKIYPIVMTSVCFVLMVVKKISEVKASKRS